MPPARSRPEAHERLEAAFREGEERCLGALQILSYVVVNQSQLRFVDLATVAEHWWLANDLGFREEMHAAVDTVFDAIEEAA